MNYYHYYFRGSTQTSNRMEPTRKIRASIHERWAESIVPNGNGMERGRSRGGDRVLQHREDRSEWYLEENIDKNRLLTFNCWRSLCYIFIYNTRILIFKNLIFKMARTKYMFRKTNPPPRMSLHRIQRRRQEAAEQPAEEPAEQPAEELPNRVR